MKQTYQEKLRSPKWQKKRLEIMDRDRFMCSHCYSGDKTLAVHHRYYLKGKEPWEYEDSCFITLCENCHEYEHSHRPEAESELLIILKQKGFTPIDIRLLTQSIARSTDPNEYIKTLKRADLLVQDDLDNHTDPTFQPIIGLLK